MSSIIFPEKDKTLTPDKLNSILENFKLILEGKVLAAYVFGSASTGQLHDESDIDLIIIEFSPDENFVERPLKYKELFRVWPKLDLLVYSQEEFENQLKDSESGFWFSVKDNLKRIL